MSEAQKLQILRDKIERARTVLTNLKSFKDWSFASYKLEAREKDIVMEAMSSYLSDLQEVLDRLEGES